MHIRKWQPVQVVGVTKAPAERQKEAAKTLVMPKWPILMR